MNRIDERGLQRSELKLYYCHTRLAEGDDTAWIQSRFRHECTQRGTHVGQNAGCLVIDWWTRTRGRFTGADLGSS